MWSSYWGQLWTAEIAAWEEKRNSNEQAKIDWQFTAQDVRQKMNRLYPS